MIHYGDNSYPSISLHDHCFSIKSVEKDLHFSFVKGFDFKKDQEFQRADKGILLIKNCELEALNITLLRSCRFFKKYVKGRVMTLNELERYLKDSELVVVDEYYSYNRLLWKCYALPFKHLDDVIEIELYHTSPIEYYVSENYKKCDD